MRTIIKTLVVALVLLGSAAEARADEFITGITITPVKVVNGLVWNTWDVTASCQIVRAAPPAVNTYFRIYLVESDLFFDDLFGPNVVCVPPGAWSPLPGAGGAFRATVTTVFRGISDYYGTDWTLRGKYVDEVACPPQHARVGGQVSAVTPTTYQYEYVLFNDPSAVGMDPTAMIVDLEVGGFSFHLNQPLPVGQSVMLQAVGGPPAIDDASNPNAAVVPWLATFADGSIHRGLTVGPEQQAAMPGNGSDLELQIAINDQPEPGIGIHLVDAGDALTLDLRSPFGSLYGQPYAVAGMIGQPPFPLMLPGDPFPSIWMDPLNTMLLVDGITSQGQLFAPVLSPSTSLTTPIPPALGGMGLDLMLQGIVLDPGHNAVNLGVSSAHLIQIR